jgi:hypothetical protein
MSEDMFEDIREKTKAVFEIRRKAAELEATE